MKIFIVSFILLTVLLIVIFVSVLTITVHYVHDGHKGEFTVRVIAFFGLFSKTFKMPKPKIEAGKNAEDDAAKVKQQIEREERKAGFFKGIKTDFLVTKDLMRLLNNSKHEIRRFLKKTVVHEFVWNSTVGTRDAALTGKLTGAVWSIKGIVQMLAYRFLTVRCQPSLHVMPYFNTSVVSTEFRCIISIRVGEAILTAIQILRYWRGGKAKVPSFRAFKNNKTV